MAALKIVDTSPKLFFLKAVPLEYISFTRFVLASKSFFFVAFYLFCFHE